MKSIKFTIILVLAILSFAPVAETKAQSVSVAVDFNTFQQELSPYGRWMNNPRYGQVWIYNDAAFRPYYTDGHWEYTNYGWSWISDYDWGWAPFHYGRWEEDPAYGWMWIPGYEWASAWVSWSSVDDYYGWAPLGYGVNINVSFGSIPYNNWTFIPRRNICDRDLNRYYVSPQRNNNFRNAVVINNYYNGNGAVGRYVRGPERREAERYTNNRIQERRVNYSDRSWNRGSNVRNRNNDAAVRNNNDNGNANNRRRNDANSNNNSATASDQPNRRRQRDINTPQTNENTNPGRRQNNDGTQSSNGENGNNPRRRDMNQNRDNNTTPPVRRPQRDVNTTPQTNGTNSPGSRPNENRWNRSNGQQNNNPQGQQPTDNRWNRRNEQQNSNPQQRQQNQAPAQQPQRPPFERRAPQQQQQSAPAMEQRRMERRGDNNSSQPRGDNGQRGGRRSN
jgi:hypothetical protein